NKFYLEADIKIEKETSILKEKASRVIDLPKKEDKQPDLQYFSAVFVSSGRNLNNAFFLPTELLSAEGTVVNKALDIEHKEDQIIGHIYDRVFMTTKGEVVDLKELSALDQTAMNEKEIHIAIAGIIYKNRFPNIAEEIANKEWKVSMECYYESFDIKVGNLIISPQEAEMLGLATKDDKILGKIAKVIKDGVEIAAGEVARVLRGICFSGCGVVKNPANPASLILETADVKGKKADIVLNYDNKVTSDKVEGQVLEIKEDLKSKKKNVEGAQDLLDSEHLKQYIESIVTASLKKLTVKKQRSDKRNKLMNKLAVIMDK
ncbi:MAG: hypothetical protein U9Q97_05740, partial [Acidobacteriota bacterium]|nr:hypothetical protein [Acidobacteriota bacterium]